MKLAPELSPDQGGTAFRHPMCFGMGRAPGFCRNPTCRVRQQCKAVDDATYAKALERYR